MESLPSQPNPWRESVRVVGHYLRAQVLIAAWDLLLYGVGFALAGVPLWVLMAILCALLSFIPQIGSLIGIAVVLLVCWIGDLDLTHLAIVGGIWVGVQAIEGFWLAPKLMGRKLGLKPLVVFLALLVASFLFGPLGLLLTVPILAISMVWIRYFRRVL